MEVFKTFLFGITGLSLIFWIFVISLWHIYMIPNLFREDYLSKQDSKPILASTSPKTNKSAFLNRGIYSRQSFVIANFNALEDGYGVNRLYSLVLFSLGVMTFILITYGLQSSFRLYGLG